MFGGYKGTTTPSNRITIVNTAAIKAPYWIVVADQASAEFCFRAKKNGPIDKRFTLENDEARKRTVDLISDRGGRSFDSHGQGRHRMTPRNEPNDVLATKFAKIIANRLVDIENKEPVSSVVLIAAPRFLGMLRKAKDVAGGVKPSYTIDKDVVGRDERFLEELLASHS